MATGSSQTPWPFCYVPTAAQARAGWARRSRQPLLRRWRGVGAQHFELQESVAHVDVDFAFVRHQRRRQRALGKGRPGWVEGDAAARNPRVIPGPGFAGLGGVDLARDGDPTGSAVHRVVFADAQAHAGIGRAGQHQVIPGRATRESVAS